MSPSHKTALLAGLEAGNRSARERGLDIWDEQCWYDATVVFSTLAALMSKDNNIEANCTTIDTA